MAKEKMTPEEKAHIREEKKAEKLRIKEEKKAERERLKAEKRAQKQQGKAEEEDEAAMEAEVKAAEIPGSATEPERRNTERRVPFFRKISFKLCIAFLIPVCFIIILGVVSYNKASAQIVETYETSVAQTMEMMNLYLTQTFDVVQTDYRDYLNDEDLGKFYRGVYDKYNLHASLPRQYIQNLSHAVLINDLVTNVYFIADEEPCITTTGVQKEMICSEYFETVQGKMVNEDKFSYHVFSNQCELDDVLNPKGDEYGARLAKFYDNADAVMLVDISKDVIDRTLESLDCGEGSIVGLITSDDVEYLSDLSAQASGPVFLGKEFLAAAESGDEMTGFSYVEDGKYLFIYSRLEERDAMICALIPKSTITGQTSDIKNLSVILIVIASIIALGLGLFMAGQYGGAINEMVARLKEVGSGDLTVDVKTKRKDEFMLLANGIGDMTANMKALVTGIKDVTGELGKASAGMAAASDNFLNSSRDIQAEIVEIDQGVENLDEEAQTSMRQMDSLSGRITEVADNSDEINRLVDGTGRVIETGMDSVTRLRESANSTTKITAQIIETIENLAEKSRSIATIINAIDEIADQTNLLSLNASIEAARAGEAGRGFAVVAQEIRKLADESKLSAEKIGRIVEEIGNSTQEATEVAKKAENIVEDQQKAVILTSESFGSIGEQVQKLMEALEVIKASVEGMEEERNTTLTSITAITAISAQTSAGASNVSEAAGRQLASVEELDKAVDALDARARELNEMLEGFRV